MGTFPPVPDRHTWEQLIQGGDVEAQEFFENYIQPLQPQLHNALDKVYDDMDLVDFIRHMLRIQTGYQPMKDFSNFVFHHIFARTCDPSAWDEPTKQEFENIKINIKAQVPHWQLRFDADSAVREMESAQQAKQFALQTATLAERQAQEAHQRAAYWHDLYNRKNQQYDDQRELLLQEQKEHMNTQRELQNLQQQHQELQEQQAQAAEVTELGQQLQTLRQTNTELQAQNASHAAQVTALEGQLQASKAESQQLKANMAALEASLQQTKASLEDAQKSLQTEKQRSETLRAECISKTASLKFYQLLSEELKESAASVVSSEQKENIAELERQLKCTQAHSQRLEEKARTDAARISAMEEELEKACGKAQFAEKNNATLQQQLADAQGHVKHLEYERSCNIHANEGLQQKLRNQYSIATAEKKELESKYTHEMEILKKQLAQTEAKKKDVEEYVANQTHELETLKKQLAKAEAEKKDLLSCINKQSQAISFNKSKVQELLQAGEEMQKVISQLVAEAEEAQKEAEGNTQDFSQNSFDPETMSVGTSGSEECLETLKEDIETLQLQLEDTEAQLTKALDDKDKVDKTFGSAVESWDKQRADMQKTIQALESQKTSDSQRIAELNDQLRKLETKLEEKKKKFETFSHELITRCEELEQELEKQAKKTAKQDTHIPVPACKCRENFDDWVKPKLEELLLFVTFKHCKVPERRKALVDILHILYMADGKEENIDTQLETLVKHLEANKGATFSWDKNQKYVFEGINQFTNANLTFLFPTIKGAVPQAASSGNSTARRRPKTLHFEESAT